ncbi:MAG: polyisoprenoid-binding protein [Nitrospira sp.]|nr:MAG: polyisoprenoid-binding protein [Nitrospira sp.]
MVARDRIQARIIIGGLLAVLWAFPAWAEMARYDVDLDHSTVEFRVAHMVLSNTSGRFVDYKGFIDMDAEAKTVKTIEATIQTASITTNQQKRDQHLRGPDFFNVEKYPTMTFKLKSYLKSGGGNEYSAAGELTLLGVTKDVVLTGAFNGVAKDPWGNVRAGFTAEGTVNRKDFGMNWSKTLDNGGLVVGDEVHIKLDIECIKAK